jgi:hypothetical protein
MPPANQIPTYRLNCLRLRIYPATESWSTNPPKIQPNTMPIMPSVSSSTPHPPCRSCFSSQINSGSLRPPPSDRQFQRATITATGQSGAGHFARRLPCSATESPANDTINITSTSPASFRNYSETHATPATLPPLTGPNPPPSSLCEAPRLHVEDLGFWNQTHPQRNYRCRPNSLSRVIFRTLCFTLDLTQLF